jgi:hypothetical protein
MQKFGSGYYAMQKFVSGYYAMQNKISILEILPCRNLVQVIMSCRSSVKVITPDGNLIYYAKQILVQLITPCRICFRLLCHTEQ